MFKLICTIVAVQLVCGCASRPYVYGVEAGDRSSSSSPEMRQQVIVGDPHPFLDASDWIWPGSWLAKLILWNRNIDSHTVSQETLDRLQTYIDKNDLYDVQILVNTYKPGLQWRRLFTNREVGAGWRFTFGILSTSIYTIIPGRFFGGDHYNPFTNTISLYSDDSAIALHEAGHAKDFNSRTYKGLNAATYLLPGAPLYYEAVSSNDALSYLHDNCQTAEEKHAYRILHPAYGTYIGGIFFRRSGVGLLMALPGHVTGAIAAARVNEDVTDRDCGNE